jgi:tetratricopeptide (TPR) repeat protein
MKIRNLAVAFAGLILMALTSFAQITAIEGVVKGADGKPVQGAMIQIVRTDIKGNYKVKTDKKGHYIYNGLPMGTYDISCEVDGKAVDQVRGIRTSPGDPKQVPFDLHAAQAQKDAQQAAIQKAAETGEVSKDLTRGMSEADKKKFEETLKKREESLKKNAALNEAYNAGKTALDNKQYDAAIESLNKAAELDPNQVAVWQTLAAAYQGNAKGKTGPDFDTNMQKCLDAYSKALALKPEEAGLHNNYALALADDKKFTEAQAELNKAAEIDPANAGKYYYNLGALETNAGQTEPASEAFKKAMDATPPYADAYYQYGIYLMGKAQTAADGKVTPVPGTTDAFQKYLEVAPTGPYAEQAKAMLTALGSSIEVQYKNPDAGKKGKKK